jgi:hypothetical protein
MNSLAKEFGVTFEGDYLYNLSENIGNFRYISIMDLKEHALTEGLESIALYVAGSISSDGQGLAFGDQNVHSSLFRSRERLSPIALSQDARVLAVHDLNFLQEPYMTTLDNSRLVSNIVDWLVTSERAFLLSDFPHFLQDATFIASADPSLLDMGVGLRDYLVAAHKQPELGQYEEASSLNGDLVFIGLFEHAVEVKEYLQKGDIWVTVSGEICGTVSDPETKDPIQGAIITVVSEEDTFETHTEGDGSYTLSILPPATYELAVLAKGYEAGGVTVDLGEGEKVEQDFALTTLSGHITGYILDADTEEPIEGAEVTVKSTKYAATTNKKGYYLIKDIPKGTYDVAASAEGYRSLAQKVEVVADETTPVTLSLAPLVPGEIGGRVTDAETGDSIKGATITAVSDEDTFKTTTGTDGNYTLDDLPSATYDVTVSADGYEEEGTTVKLGTEEGIEQNFALTPLRGSIEGYVLDADTEEPIEDAEVTVKGTKHTTTTDKKGYYLIEDVPAGTYDVAAGTEGYKSLSKKVKAVADETVETDFALVTPLVIEIKDVGRLRQKGTSMCYLNADAHRQVLICLADTAERLEEALNLLETGEFRQWLVSDTLTVYQDLKKSELE